jgi:hypothetical protein
MVELDKQMNPLGILISTGHAEATNGGCGPKQGVPLPAAHSATRGAGEPAGSLSIQPTIDGALYLAAEIWAEGWPVAHNRELWKNDGTGWSFDE